MMRLLLSRPVLRRLPFVYGQMTRRLMPIDQPAALARELRSFVAA